VSDVKAPKGARYLKQLACRVKMFGESMRSRFNGESNGVLRRGAFKQRAPPGLGNIYLGCLTLKLNLGFSLVCRLSYGVIK